MYNPQFMHKFTVHVKSTQPHNDGSTASLVPIPTGFPRILNPIPR